MVAVNNMIKADRLCPTGKKMKAPSKGKRKIDIKRIEDQGKRQVTFSKRRVGLFKKAGELSLLCGTQMAVVVESPAGNFFTFGHPDTDLIIHRYLTGSRPTEFGENLDDIMHHHQMESMNRRYSELCKELDTEKKKKGTINNGVVTAAACESADLERVFWWEGEEEGFDDDKEIEEYMLALQDLKTNLLSRAEDLSLLMANPSPSSSSAPVSSTSDDVNLLQEIRVEVGDNYAANNNAAAAVTATADDDEEEWMNRVMAMMEEEGGDLCGLASNTNNFWIFGEGDEQFNCLIN